jgi:hypothetical protein
MTVMTQNLFMRGHPNRKMCDRHLGPLTLKEQIGKHNYILKLPTTARLHQVFYVNNIRLCSTYSLRHAVHVTNSEGDDDEFEVSHICGVHQVVT